MEAGKLIQMAKGKNLGKVWKSIQISINLKEILLMAKGMGMEHSSPMIKIILKL